MSKYRVEFKTSRLLLVFQLVTYVLLVLSVFSWQTEIIQFQLLVQILLVIVFTFFVFKIALYHWRLMYVPVVYSLQGEWLESSRQGQVGWKITDKSRVSHFLLFIHLVSPINTSQTKWCLVFKDQVTERDYRRLCCAVIYQQQAAGRN